MQMTPDLMKGFFLSFFLSFFFFFVRINEGFPEPRDGKREQGERKRGRRGEDMTLYVVRGRMRRAEEEMIEEI